MIPAAAIERVIDVWETRIEDLMRFYPIHVENGFGAFVKGEINAYGMAVKELKKVLDDYGKGKP